MTLFGEPQARSKGGVGVFRIRGGGGRAYFLRTFSQTLRNRERKW